MYGIAVDSMISELFALLSFNLRSRWREWRTGEPDEGVFLPRMRAMWAADVIRPRASLSLRLVRSNTQRGRQALRRIA